MGLVAHYPLVEDGKDYSQNKKHCSTNNLSLNKSGKIGQCIKFGNSIIQTPIAFNQSYEAFSISFWMYPVSGGTAVLGTIGSSRTFNLYNWPTAADMHFSSYVENEQTYTLEQNVIVPERWNHVVFTYDSKILRSYYNGKPGTEQEIKIGRSDERLYLGRNDIGFFSGKLNDVYFYDHVLSIKEIKKLYQSELLHLTCENISEAGSDMGNFKGKIYDIGKYHNDIMFDSDTKIKLSEDAAKGSHSILFENGVKGLSDLGDFYASNDFTYVCWIKPGDNDSPNPILAQIDLEDSDVCVRGLEVKEGSLSLWGLKTSNEQERIDYPISLDKWSFVAATKNDDLFSLYLNGEKIAEKNIPSVLDGGNLRIGYYHQNSEIYTGLIDDIRIYATALTCEEIKSLYEVKARVYKNGSIECSQIKEESNPSTITNKFQLITPLISEVGVTKQMIAYFPTIQDLTDKTKNRYEIEYMNGTSGITPTENGLYFDGTNTMLARNIFSQVSDQSCFTIQIDVSDIENTSDNETGYIMLSYPNWMISIGKLKTSNAYQVYFRGANTTQYLTSTVTYNTCLLAITYDSTSQLARLYIDGVMQAETIIEDMLTYDKHFALGGWTDYSQQSKGTLHSLKVFNRALTIEEVKIEYETLKNKKCLISNNSVFASNFIEK